MFLTGCPVVNSRPGGRTIAVFQGSTPSSGILLWLSEVFDLDSGHWTLLDALLPFDRASQDCAATPNGYILAIGGATHDSGTLTYLDNVDKLPPQPRDLR